MNNTIITLVLSPEFLFLCFARVGLQYDGQNAYTVPLVCMFINYFSLNFNTPISKITCKSLATLCKGLFVGWWSVLPRPVLFGLSQFP